MKKTELPRKGELNEKNKKYSLDSAVKRFDYAERRLQQR